MGGWVGVSIFLTGVEKRRPPIYKYEVDPLELSDTLVTGRVARVERWDQGALT